MLKQKETEITELRRRLEKLERLMGGNSDSRQLPECGSSGSDLLGLLRWQFSASLAPSPPFMVLWPGTTNSGDAMKGSVSKRRPREPMKTPSVGSVVRHFVLLAFLLTLDSQLSTAHAQGIGTAFTYQGRLNAAGQPANGLYDLRFRLATDALANNYVASPIL